MLVNEPKPALAMMTDTEKPKSNIASHLDTAPARRKVTFQDQQPYRDNQAQCVDESTLKPGDTVRLHTKGRMSIATIAKPMTLPNGTIRYKIRPLGSSEEIVVANNQISAIDTDPADIPPGPTDVNQKLLQEAISEADMQRLWSIDTDGTTTKTDRLALL